jgi:hypothetical protein
MENGSSIKFEIANQKEKTNPALVRHCYRAGYMGRLSYIVITNNDIMYRLCVAQ